MFQQWEHLPHIVALPIMAGTKHISKQPLLAMWPAVASKPYYNYPQYNAYNNGNGGMFGAYLTFDNYSKKKKRYAIHSKTNVGISLVTYNGVTANFGNTIAKRLDTVSNYTSGNNIPSYRDSVTAYGASIKYNSTNIGLDVQQVFCTNQKKRVSAFAGIGASVNFSVTSIIRESLDKERGINNTTNPAYSYQKNGVSLQDEKTDFMLGNTYKIKSSVLYQFYIPAGITIRFGNNEKSKLSHFYLSPQIKVGYN